LAATIRDVASAARVAPSTVSRALNGSTLVSPGTRDRVEQAAARLGYEPSRAARSLVTGRTGTIGLIVPDLSNPFFPGIVKGVQARAQTANLAVFVADSDEDQAVETRLIRRLAKQADGLMLCSPRSGADVIRELASAASIVLVNRRVDELPAITVDNADGMRQAVAHLVALGHERVGFVAGPAASWSGAQRLRGLRAAARAANLELVEAGNFPPHFEGGVAAADIVIAHRLTAVIAYNDVVALGLLSRLSARGVNVPEQISVVGCDDIATARMSSPALSTVALPKEQAGRQAVDLLLEVMQHPDHAPPTHRTLPTQLMVRESTGPAPQP
jgi:DNA-binding LacI/PurR family transcriptional regulator